MFPGIKKLFVDETGSVAIMFALALTLLLVEVFCAIDYARAYDQQLIIQNALDAAALAAAASPAATDAEIQRIGQSTFNANVDGQITARDLTTSFSLSSDRTVVVARAQGSVGLSVPNLFGMDAIAVGARSEVQRAGEDVEVALVLDTTASMNGSALSDLKIAAADLVDAVVKDQQSPFYSKVALVPYSMAVNVGNYATDVRGSYTANTCASPHCQWFRFRNPFGNYQTFQISTCVSERSGTNAFTDTAPSVDPLGPNYPAPGNPCLSNKVLPLTNDKQSLKAAITSLQAAGSTAGHIGVAWGWYMVSPNFGYIWPTVSRPADYKKEHLQKFVVIMTDGEYNSSYCDGVISQDSTTGSGAMSDHIACNAPNGPAYSQSLSLCGNMKAKGVIVYTIGFNLTNTQQARDLVTKCATDATHVYLPTSGSELKDAFRSIGADIGKLRISS